MKKIILLFSFLLSFTILGLTQSNTQPKAKYLNQSSKTINSPTTKATVSYKKKENDITSETMKNNLKAYQEKHGSKKIRVEKNN